MNMKNGTELIRQERERQLAEKGYSSEHDDKHDIGELGLAAALYAMPYEVTVDNEPLLNRGALSELHITLATGCNFYLKPEPNKLRRLVKAGALIAAEIDRLQRKESDE